MSMKKPREAGLIRINTGLAAYTGGRRPEKKKMMAKITPTTASIQAMFTAVPAMPEKPNTAAISAMMKNVTAHEIIWSSPFKLSPKKSGDRYFPHRGCCNGRSSGPGARGAGRPIVAEGRSVRLPRRGAAPGIPIGSPLRLEECACATH